jgi:AcrR family transcriptional regulator
MVDGVRAKRRAASAERILDAARAEFGDRGHDGATIRGIAARAGVDPALVLQHFGSKAALFARAIEPVDDVELSTVPEHLLTVMEHRMAGLPEGTRAVMRSMLTSADAAQAMRDYLDERVRGLAGSLDGDRSMEATTVVAAVLGLTIGRHFLDLPSLRDLTDADLSQLTAALLRIVDEQ